VDLTHGGGGPGRVIFILSSERSGSTLLRLMLGAHSAIASSGELFLLRYPDFESWYQAKPMALHSIVDFFESVGRPLGAVEIRHRCRGWTTAQVYRWLLECLGDKQMLVDKTPAYANEFGTLERSLEFAPFYIWLTRHPLGVIHSARRRRQRRSRAGSLRRMGRALVERFEELADSGMSRYARDRERKWQLQQRNILRFLSAVPESGKVQIPYERLVSRPEAIAQDLCRRLGIDYEEAMLNPFVKLPRLIPGLGDDKVQATTRIESTFAHQWRLKYRENALMAETRDLMKDIGIES
jgi:hypothetical protein